MTLLREQIRIRQKVFHQNVTIAFTCSRRQRPIEEIIEELAQYIREKSACDISNVVHHPSSLIGKAIWHRFDEDGQEKWYDGTIVSY